jgi:hypothetical protein
MTATVARPADSPRLQPPEMRFWRRYSPHHEASLSGAGSFAIHIVIVSLLLLAGYLGWLSFGSRRPAVPVSPIVLAPGAGGEKTGTPELKSDTSAPRKEVADQAMPDAPGTGGGDNIARPELGPVRSETPSLPPLNTKDANTQVIKDAKANSQGFQSLADEIGRKLGLGRQQPSAGKGGSGARGGKGTGDGPGDGPGTGPNGTLNPRVQRMLRWTMQFDTHSGKDYLAQLRGLGAILAIPKERGGNQFWVIRDLSTPKPKLLDEDVRALQRIFWTDNKPESVASVMRALGLDQNPDRFVAFMPQELEEKLFDMELRFRGLREDEIAETVFQVRVVNGKYTPYVVSQKEKR